MNATPLLEVAIHEEDERGNVYTLLKPLLYCDLEIPEGFESDGASVPRFFWRAVFPPGDTRALRPAVIHDFIYRTHPEGWSKEDADKAFFDLLVRAGIPKRRAVLAYLGVRIFGGSSWKANNK